MSHRGKEQAGLLVRRESVGYDNTWTVTVR
jgi:hypothetical protein